MWRALSSLGGWELAVPTLVGWAVPGMGGGSPVVAGQNCFGPLVGDIHLGGEVDSAFTFCRSMTGHPFSYFPLGPNPQGALTMSRQQVPPSGSPELDRTELAFAPVC